MSEYNLPDAAQLWVNVILIWIGFSAVVGLVVRSLLPGKEPGGLMGTLLIGVLGSCIGPFTVSILWEMENFNPIGPIGFCASTISAFACLLLFRIFHILFFRKSGNRA